MRTSTRQGGFSLIELVLFIVIVGIAVAAITTQYATNVQHSIDPMLRQKALAVANAHMDTLQGTPFSTISTYNDTSVAGFDVNVAVSSANPWSAASPAESIPAGDVKKIDITVTIAATGESLAFTLYRTRY